MIEVNECTVHLTEQTIKEINKAIAKAHEKISDFSDDSMPEGDMSTDTYIRERAKRGKIFIKSPYMSRMEFWIDLRICESEGYQWYYPEEVKKESAISIGRDVV